jgi:hypothetical protein
MTRKAGVAAIVLLTVSICLSGCSDMPLFWPDEEFDAQKWKSTPELQRYVFANDLVDGKLIGLTRAQIEAMLGPNPRAEHEPMKYAVKETSSSSYNFVVFIYVRFDANGRANEVGIGED